MNQHDYKHYQFPRTTNQAFGSFIPLRKTMKLTPVQNTSHRNSRLFWLIISVIIFTLITGCANRPVQVSDYDHATFEKSRFLATVLEIYPVSRTPDILRISEVICPNLQVEIPKHLNSRISRVQWISQDPNVPSSTFIVLIPKEIDEHVEEGSFIEAELAEYCGGLSRIVRVYRD